ncbi:CBS domain-containing protein [Gracilinema caldarium]|uniref:CBS domain-containing protein n=1 Tax=Gracilinema caldarium TaxID=215591 RepID=UPI0026E9CED6|nr:CBS domain-containing protein [Gracilinema caldarium]
MKLSNFMDPKLVLLKADVSSVEEAIKQALQVVVKNYKHDALNYDNVLKLVQEREALGGTVLPSGVAIPHARVPLFNDFLIASVIPKKPILVTHQDREIEVKIIYLFIISQTASTIYLNALAKIAESSKSEEIMKKLLAAEMPHQFVEVFEQAGYLVKKDLTVADIMTTEVVSLKKSATLKELTDLMYTKHLRYVPILDDSGKLVGEIGVIDLIKAGIPDYAFRIGSLKFLSELEPMTELLLKEDKITVESIMNKNPAALKPNTSVIEVAFEMSRNKKRHYAICDNGKLVGVVSAMDLLSKVLRA